MVHDTTYYSFWEQALGITIFTDMSKQIFQVCFKTIKDNDLIWMQYKELQMIYCLNLIDMMMANAVLATI